MTIRSKNIFTTVRTEGAILPADLLQRVVDGDKALDGLSPTSYHLLEGEKLNEAINRSWSRLRGAWVGFKAALEKLPPHDPGTSVTRDRLLLPLFQELGYGRLTAAKAIELESRSYPISHGWLHTPIHLVGWRVDLDRRTAGVAGAARSSPHSLVQELLNRSQEHLWAIASNGRQVRILRDNVNLTRQAYVEFDLEAMMAGEVYADFVLLWLLCHQSRVETEKPEQCWLEQWSKTAQEQGTRALDQLRRGVEVAIATLGQGFLSHTANRELRQKLQSGQLSTQDYYRQLLRLVYRLLFLFVVEDRGFLLDPKADVAARERYTLYYSTARLRTLAEKRRGTRHADLFFGLRLVMQKLGSSEGCRSLGLPALGSLLWSEAFVADTVSCQIANAALLEAIRALAFITDKHGRRPVDYKNLRSEELGSVYEALLELHPELNVSAGTFALTTAAGNERKTTGSYYTPESLVQCLLDSALDPVVDEAIQQADPEAAILNLKVCDPACGSGHFLIAAAHRMAKGLAAIRTGDEEPSPEATQKALRDVIGRCIYGVDVNPMAVELCKVALWMEALEPGKPLSFLEHHIQCGNSLLGATPALLRKGIPDEAFTPIEGDDKAYCSKYKKQNKQEQEKGQLTLLDERNEPWERLGDLATSLVSLNQIADDVIAGVERKQTQYEEFVKSTPYVFSRFWADAWCAAFVWKKRHSEELLYPITDEVFRQIERSPFHAADWMKREVERLRDQYKLLHWHLAFPDVFRISNVREPDNEKTGWSGGFDAVIGNPPWEMPETDDRIFFAMSRPDITAEASAQKRRSTILRLASDDKSLFDSWVECLQINESQRIFFSLSGNYPNSGGGRLNYYRLFVERDWQILNCVGFISVIVPSGIATNKYEEQIWHYLLKNHAVSSIYDFENTKGFFSSVHRSTKFSLLTLTKKRSSQMTVGCWLHQVSDVRDSSRTSVINVSDLEAFSPDSLALPQFREAKDLRLLQTTHKKFKSFSKEISWKHTLRLMFSSSDSDFVVVESNDVNHLFPSNTNRLKLTDDITFVPVYEGKMVDLFDHRKADVYINSKNQSRQAQERIIPIQEKFDQNRFVIPQSWISEEVVRKKRFDKEQKDWLFVFCDVTSATNSRTCIPAIIPLAGLTRSMPAIYLASSSARESAVLLSILSSFPLDFFVRFKVSTNHLTQGIMESLPTPTLSNCLRYEETMGNKGWIVARVLELTYTAWDLQPFAKDCGYDGAPFRWDEDRRFLLRCELDAAYFHLYSIQRDDVDYIMETFPIVKRKDEKAHRHYRTKDKILEIYDAMAEAMKMGQSYQTLLDPPPADPSVTHPNVDH